VDALPRLVDCYVAMVVDDSPTFATFLGLHTNDSELGDFSGDALDDKRNRRARLLDEVEALPTEGVPTDIMIDVEVLRTALRRAIFDHDVLRTHERNPGLYVSTALFGCNQLVLREFAPMEDRARSLLERLGQVPGVLSACERNVVSPPPVFAESAAEMARGGAVFLGEIVPGIAERVPALRSDLVRAAADAAAAFDRTADHFAALASRGGPPFHAGRQAYEWLLAEVHMLEFDGDELLEIGTRALSETKREMAEVSRRVDSSRSWRDVVEELQSDHPSEETLKAFYASQMERARDFVLEQGIATVPECETLDVVDTPEYLRTLLPYAAYGPAGPFEEEQRGFFYVTPIPDDASPEDAERQLRGHGVHNVAIIAVHEGYPGHHLQLTRANLVPSKARRLARNNVFVEGWALYCEQMMREVGFWDDAKTQLSQLKAALWRAARVVVDVGLQRGEMTLDEAVYFMVGEAGLVRVQAVAEVKRYTANPTQPSSYLIGKQAIMSIRERFERAQGSAFSLREFHDRLLDVGSIPPRLAAAALGLDGGNA
jgi:uncharacterized protein (DUF885 family)